MRPVTVPRRFERKRKAALPARKLPVEGTEEYRQRIGVLQRYWTERAGGKQGTRGGVGTVLNELARDSGFGVALWEERLPIRDVVNGACEILGIDPLYVANEGKLLAAVAPGAADDASEALRSIEGGEEAEIIGEVREEPARMVLMHTGFGGTRMIDMLVGDPLPRIC